MRASKQARGKGAPQTPQSTPSAAGATVPPGFQMMPDISAQPGGSQPRSPRLADLLQLQRTLGNRAVSQLFDQGGSASTGAPRPDVSTPAGLVQRKIGKDGHNKKVIHVRTRRVYTAKKTVRGNYNLYTEGNILSATVSAEDDAYDLYQAPPSSGFGITVSQKDRRVFTTMPPAQTSGAFTTLHQQGKGEKADFSYGDMSNALHSALDNGQLTPGAIESAIQSGLKIPLEEGEIKLDPGQDQSLQLIPFHLLQYQKFHTPPTLKSDARKAENPFRQEELDTTKDLMQQGGAEALKLMLPKLPPGSTKATELRDIYPGPIDIGLPPDEKTE